MLCKGALCFLFESKSFRMLCLRTLANSRRPPIGRVRCDQYLGGLLKSYRRAA